MENWLSLTYMYMFNVRGVHVNQNILMTSPYAQNIPEWDVKQQVNMIRTFWLGRKKVAAGL